jgi:triacylglycerol lipase
MRSDTCDTAATACDVPRRSRETGRSPINVAERAIRLARRAVRVHATELALITSTAVRAPLYLMGTVANLPSASDTVDQLRAAPSYPVVLVHGFCGSKSSWSTVAHRLQTRGMSVHTFSYAPFGCPVEQLADRLVAEVHRILSRTGAAKVHLVGHSLGGVLVAAAAAHNRLNGRVDTVITLGAPFGGSPWARLLPFGGIAQALRDGSPLLTRLAAAPVPKGVRWLAITAPLDFVVPGSRSVPAHGQAEHVTVTDVGHLGMLLNHRVVERIAEALVPVAVPDAISA